MSQSLVNKRSRAFTSQKGKCFYCDIPMWNAGHIDHDLWSGITKKALSRVRCTVEHLQASCDGGSDAAENLVAACHFCNQARHRRVNPPGPRKFRKIVVSRVRAGKWHPVYYHKLYRD